MQKIIKKFGDKLKNIGNRVGWMGGNQNYMLEDLIYEKDNEIINIRDCIEQMSFNGERKKFYELKYTKQNAERKTRKTFNFAYDSILKQQIIDEILKEGYVQIERQIDYN